MAKKKRPGRPPKYNGPVKRLNVILPYEIAIEMEKEKGDKSWTDFFLMLYSKHKSHSEG